MPECSLGIPTMPSYHAEILYVLWVHYGNCWSKSLGEFHCFPACILVHGGHAILNAVLPQTHRASPPSSFVAKLGKATQPKQVHTKRGFSFSRDPPRYGDVY